MPARTSESEGRKSRVLGRVSVLLAVVALPPYASCCWLPARDHHVKGVTAWHTAKEGASMAPSLVDVLPDTVTVPKFTTAYFGGEVRGEAQGTPQVQWLDVRSVSCQN